MNHVVSFSGGLGSWVAAKRVAEKYGTENLYLVVADVFLIDPVIDFPRAKNLKKGEIK